MPSHKSPYLLMMSLFAYLSLGNPDVLASLSASKISATEPINQSSWQLALNFKLPSRGAPGTRRKGAGVRNSCPKLANSEEELTALVPGTNLGLTVSERPTFWFYVPYPSNSHLAVEFLLQNPQGKKLYQQTFPLVETPGIVSIALPKTVSPLEIDKLYRWRFSVICNPNNRQEDLYVEGGLERSRLTPELRNRLEKATPREPGSKLLLVCVKAEERRYPYAQLHLVQNPAEANPSLGCHYLPHWPQPGLVPRSQQRGDRSFDFCRLSALISGLNSWFFGFFLGVSIRGSP